MGMTVQPYKSQSEMRRVHPEIKNWKCILQAPRGMSAEVQLTQLRKVIEKRNLPKNLMVYQVGEFFWIPEAGITPLCRCLERIGDNGPCLVHGNPLGQAEARS